MACFVAHLAGKGALLALLLHETLLSFHIFRAALWALKGGGQADGPVDEARVRIDLHVGRQREPRVCVLLFPVRRLQRGEGSRTVEWRR